MTQPRLTPASLPPLQLSDIAEGRRLLTRYHEHGDRFAYRAWMFWLSAYGSRMLDALLDQNPAQDDTKPAAEPAAGNPCHRCGTSPCVCETWR